MLFAQRRTSSTLGDEPGHGRRKAQPMAAGRNATARDETGDPTRWCRFVGGALCALGCLSVVSVALLIGAAGVHVSTVAWLALPALMLPAGLRVLASPPCRRRFENEDRTDGTRA
jgi:hypothetical protein